MEKNVNKKLTNKKVYRTLETKILRIRYNWKSIIKRIIIVFIPVIPLIILAINIDKINMLKAFIEAFTLEIMGYRISFIHILIYVLIGSIILLIVKLLFKPDSYEEYNDNIKNALTKKESSGDIV